MDSGIWFSLRLSALVAILAALVCAMVGIPLAYVLAKKRFWGRELLDGLVAIPLVLPPTVTGYFLILLLGRQGWIGGPIYRLTGWSLPFTWQAAVVAAAVVALPLLVRAARAAIAAVDPDLERDAMTLGLGEWAIALTITLPLAWRGLLAGLSLCFTRALGEFGATLMLAGNIPGRTNTLPLEVYRAFEAGDDDRVRLVVVLLTLLSFLVLIVSERLSRATD